jgi:pyochelin biosynthetic protein PchG
VNRLGENGSRKLRVVVCGTTFGQVYLAALARANSPFELVGVLARGSRRSRSTAERYGVPLFTDTAQVPEDIDIACVVVRSTSMGGNGTDLAKHFIARGIHVMQEHPVHHDELADCLAIAAQYGVVYYLNTFYPQLLPVRQFLEAARRLLTQQRPVYVDAACAIQVAYSLFDILGQTLRSVRPWRLVPQSPIGDSRQELTEAPIPFRSVDAVIAGVPLTLRIQNQTDPSDPDNHLHLLHRVTIGTRGGNLTLLNTHGPLLWSQSMHIPASIKESFDLRAAPAPYLDQPSAASIGPAQAPTYRQILGEMWPDAIGTALLDMRRAVLAGDDCRGRGQYQLSICQIWREVTSSLGYPEMIAGEAHEPLTHIELGAGDDLVAERLGQ